MKRKTEEVRVDLKDMHNPFLLAAATGDITRVMELNNSGFDPNATLKNGMTALHLAAKRGDVEMIDALLENPRVNFNAQDKQGKTAIYLATEDSDFKLVVELLLALERINPMIGDKKGITPLHVAARDGDYEIVSLILQFLFSLDYDRSLLNPADKKGTTPLHLAAMQNDIRMVEMIIQHVNPSPKDKHGRTPVELATEAEVLRLIRSAEDAWHKAQEASRAPSPTMQSSSCFFHQSASSSMSRGNVGGEPAKQNPLIPPKHK